MITCTLSYLRTAKVRRYQNHDFQHFWSSEQPAYAFITLQDRTSSWFLWWPYLQESRWNHWWVISH